MKQISFFTCSHQASHHRVIQPMHRQQYCPDPSAKKILPTQFHDHLHLEPLLIHKPCPSTSQETTWFHFKNLTGFHKKKIKIIVQFLAISSLFSQLVKEM